MSRNELKVRIHQLETELKEAHHELFQAQFALGSVKLQDEAFEKMNGERIELKKKNREKHEMIGEMVKERKEMEKVKDAEIEKLKVEKMIMEEAKDEEIKKLKKELEKMRMENTTAESSQNGPSISQD
ncbi:unnamed protein product [Caenorhabditis brenneri]